MRTWAREAGEDTEERERGEPLRFATDEALSAYLSEQRLHHVQRWSLSLLAPRVEAPLQPQLRPVISRRRLVEVLSDEAAARWEAAAGPSPKVRSLIPLLALQLLEDEARQVAEARRSLAERRLPPPEPRAHALHARLLDLRDTFPEAVAPRRWSGLRPDSLAFDPDRPVVTQEGLFGAELPVGAVSGYVLPRAQLTFTPALQGRCTCGATHCVHLLALVDTLLRWLHEPWTKRTAERVEALLLAPWERTLRALEQAVEAAPRGAVEVSWRIDVLGGFGVLVTPYLLRRTRSGQLSAGAMISRRKLLSDHAGELSERDLRIAALLSDRDEPASRALLRELCDHPQVQRNDRPEQTVRIDRARLSLIAQDRGDAVQLSIGVDGTALPTALLDRARRGDPEEALFLWDEGACRLTLLEVTPEVRAAVVVLKRHEGTFPRESHPLLVERLARLAQRLPVALPRSVMGERVPPSEQPVLRLEAQPGGAVCVELRIRPLPDGPSFVPAEGSRDVHVRRGAAAFHAVRDFARERALADACLRSLPLRDAEEEEGSSYRRRFPSAHGALALLKACALLEAPPALEWVGVPLRTAPARASQLRLTLERRRDWFGVLGGLAVEGERVELARLLEAAKRGERYVPVSATTWVEIEEALREHLARLSDHAHATRHGLEIGPSAVDALQALEAAGVEVEADAAWQALVHRIFAASDRPAKVPRGLKAKLRAYQTDGFRWLSRLAAWGAGGVLADDMGLGKTVQALALLLDRSAEGPSLVVAPTSVAWNWVEEAKRFAPGLRLRLFGEAADRGSLLQKLGPRDVLVISYGLLARDIERLAQVRFGTIVFDEAQLLKNAGTQRFRAARTLQGGFKVALSGTPLENHLGELWSVFAAVFPALLGSWEAFRTRYAGPVERGTDPTAGPALARVLAPFLLRRTKAQVEAELPPRTLVQVPIVLSREEFTLYEDARLAALSELETTASKLREQQRRVEVLAALTRLRLLASHPRLFDPRSAVASSKLERFLELVEELRAEGHRALVFSQFTRHLALVREVLDAQGIRYEYLDGQTPEAARPERVRAFEEGDAPLFLISLKAGGFGLNLTSATTVIHLDPWWNPAVEDQASDRAHRIGQTRPVTIYRLVARGTIEEKILGLHADKRALVAQVLDGKERAAKLTSAELLGLLAQGTAPREDDDPGELH